MDFKIIYRSVIIVMVLEEQKYQNTNRKGWGGGVKFDVSNNWDSFKELQYKKY